jgi:serine/threonine-protein kinase
MSDPNRLIDDLKRRCPDAVELATYASPAVRVEPELLRTLRLGLLPASGSQTEADLWFSPLVRARGPDGITLRDDVRQVLRTRLREYNGLSGEQSRAERAWEIIEAVHETTSPALALEERIAWLVISDAGDDRVERELDAVLRAIEGGRRANLLRWASNAWARLPPGARKTRAGWLLGQVSGAAAHGPVRVTTAPDGLEQLDLALLIGNARTALGVRRIGHILELGAVSGPDATAIDVLDTQPRLVEVIRGEPRGRRPRSVPIPSGTVVRVEVGQGRVRIVTALHEVYELAPAKLAALDIFALLAAAPTSLSTAIIDFQVIVHDRARNFVVPESTLAAIDAALDDPKFPSGYVMVTGPPGVGKTALICHLVSSRGYVHHFNSRATGIRSPEAFLGNICAQLIVRYGLGYATLPAEATHDAAFLSHLLVEATAKAAGEAVVVLIDALDEAKPAGLAANPLLLPEALPEGAFIVVTARSSADNPLAVDRRRDVRLALDSRDVLEYVTRQLEANPETLTRLHTDANTLASLLTERGEGNFAYITYVMADLVNGRLQLETPFDLPRGLRDYYEGQWQILRAGDPEQFSRIDEPILRVLAIADGPVSVATLEHETGLSSVTLQEVIRRFQPFLEEVDSEYRVYHSSFRDFLADRLGLTPGSADEQMRAALARARGIADPVARADALVGLTPRLTDKLRGAVAAEALASSSAIRNERARTQLITALAPYLAAEGLGDALAEARAISDNSLRGEVLVALAPQLDDRDRIEVLAEALRVAETIEDHRTRASVFMDIARLLPNGQREPVLEKALDSTHRVQDGSAREELLLAIIRVQPESDPFQSYWPMSKPFLDRRALRSGVRLAMGPEGPKILMVNGPPGSGKSYSSLLIRHVAEQTRAFDTLIVNFDQPERVADRPVDLAREIADGMGVSAGSMPAQRDTTSRFIHELARWLIQLARAGDKDWWWIFDGVSSQPISSDLKYLIEVLAREVVVQADVRLILLGFDEPLPANIERDVYREDLTEIGESEIRELIADLLANTDGKAFAERIDVLLKYVLEVGAVPANTRLATLSLRLEQLRNALMAEAR